MKFDISKVRNIGMIAHIDAGKTTTTEVILNYTGKEHKIGKVDEGTATTDWMQEEQERGITITSAATTCYWEDHRINIIDTPGHVDFTAEVERSLRVLDGAVGIFCGVAGVQAQSETVWRQADKHKIPRIIYINKMDRVGANFARVLESLDKKLHIKPLPIQIPYGVEREFKGIIDLIEEKVLIFQEDSEGREIEEKAIPPECEEEVEKYRTALLEKLCDYSDEFTEKYLEGELTTEDIHTALRELTIKNEALPLLVGSSLRWKGVQPLLQAILAYLPSPAEVAPQVGQNAKGEEIIIFADPKKPLVALVFKIMSEEHGDLTYLRIYSGKLSPREEILNTNKDKRERIGQVYLMHANQREKVKSAQAGEIVAVMGLKHAATGDTLCKKPAKITLENIEFPHTVISMAIEPKSNKDRGKIESAMKKLEKEDPTFEWKTDCDTGQTIISGMGELHLEIITHRLLSNYNVDARVGKPRVSYKQTIEQTLETEGEFIREQSGNHHYAKVTLQFEPWKSEEARELVAFENKAPNQISPEFASAVEEGIRESAEGGVGWGYPLVHFKTTLIGGKQNEDSSELAFSAAASMALRQAIDEMGTTLLEPVMKIEITVPEEFMGDIIQDLHSRRAEIREVEKDGALCLIRVVAPLSKMFGYAVAQRSLSQGRASFSMEPYMYAPVHPDDVPQFF